MASAELAVAKVSLSGALFRPDPAPCSRDQIEDVLALLNSTTSHCSPANVQKCKQWALGNLVPSTSRMAPFVKYLVALSGSFQPETGAAASNQSNRPKETSAKRKRLHVLYILSDILYHVKFRLHDGSFAAKLEPTLPALVRSAASFQNSPNHIKKIRRLIALWEDNEYFTPPFLAKLRAAIDGNTSEEAHNSSQEADSASLTAKAVKAAPYVLPAMHGDLSTPWYDLPAGNWLPVLEPNSTRPMNPNMIKPLQLASGPADKKLAEAVKQLLLDVDKIYAKDLTLGHATADIGQMGERVELDELGDVVAEETYYGWSRPFCQKMQARRKGKDNRGRRSPGRSSKSSSPSRSRSATPRRGRDRDSSIDSSRPAFKRRRMSSTSPPRNRGRNTSQSGSGSRSRSRDSGHARGRDYSPSRGRSQSRPGHRYRSRSRSRNQDYPPLLPGLPPSGPPSRPQLGNGFPPPPPNGPGPGNFHFPPPPQPHQAFSGRPSHPPQSGFPGYPGPVPPPPPPNYQGQWPPPPPPMGNQAQGFYPEDLSQQPFAGGWSTHTLGPPPPQGNFGGYGGRGGHGGSIRGNNAGGRGRYGRGGW